MIISEMMRKIKSGDVPPLLLQEICPSTGISHQYQEFLASRILSWLPFLHRNETAVHDMSVGCDTHFISSRHRSGCQATVRVKDRHKIGVKKRE